VAIPESLRGRLSVPVVAAPMFIVSGPELVIAQCKAGVVGSFPALNARPQACLDEWLTRIREELDAHDRAHPDQLSAPVAVNQIAHGSNARLEQDLETCIKHRVPIVITSLGAREEVNKAIHSYGGLVLHDVINDRFARKAIEKGADGLIAVAAGAGGHAGTTSPLALIADIRRWFDGPLLLSGCIATGDAVFAAQAMGADLAYVGSAFIATHEANAPHEYKQMVVDGAASDIVYSSLFSGVAGNYLKPSIAKAGLDPDALPSGDPKTMNFGAAKGESPSAQRSGQKAWKEIWGCGQGIGPINEVVDVADLVARLSREYAAARTRLSGPAPWSREERLTT